MPTPVFALLVLAGAAVYFMKPDERRRLARTVVDAVRRTVHDATHTSADDPFAVFLRARVRWPIATPLLIALNIVVAVAYPNAIADWGNLGTRTTNGEWWRLLTAPFVHAGLLHVAVTMVALGTVGAVLERAIGRLAFAIIYMSAALVSAVISLSTASPTSVTFGASGAVFGIYGLLVAAVAYALIRPAEFSIPRIVAKRVAAAAVLFVLYNLFTDHLSTQSEMAGLGTGFFGGLVVARGVMQEQPRLQRAAMVMAVTAVIALAGVVPMRAIIDVRPEIEQVLAVEARTAGAYDAAAAKFRVGRLPAKALVQVIDATIIPDLEAIRARLKDLRGVSREQAPLVSAAQEYVQLREQSWRARADALRKSKMDLLRKAEAGERAALDAFEKMRTISDKAM